MIFVIWRSLFFYLALLVCQIGAAVQWISTRAVGTFTQGKGFHCKWKSQAVSSGALSDVSSDALTFTGRSVEDVLEEISCYIDHISGEEFGELLPSKSYDYLRRTLAKKMNKTPSQIDWLLGRGKNVCPVQEESSLVDYGNSEVTYGNSEVTYGNSEVTYGNSEVTYPSSVEVDGISDRESLSAPKIWGLVPSEMDIIISSASSTEGEPLGIGSQDMWSSDSERPSTAILVSAPHSDTVDPVFLVSEKGDGYCPRPDYEEVMTKICKNRPRRRTERPVSCEALDPILDGIKEEILNIIQTSHTKDSSCPTCKRAF